MYAGPSAEELDEQEMTFLEDIYQLMQAAHFRLLSADDWKTAQAEQFTVNHPISYPHRHLLPGRKSSDSSPQDLAKAGTMCNSEYLAQYIPFWNARVFPVLTKAEQMLQSSWTRMSSLLSSLRSYLLAASWGLRAEDFLCVRSSIALSR